MGSQKSAHWLTAPGLLSPATAIVFSLICWIVFSRVFDTSDPSQLPALTRRFLAIQPWWLVAGALSALGHVFLGADSAWRSRLRNYDRVLMIASVLGIAWGIVAIHVLTLSMMAI